MERNFIKQVGRVRKITEKIEIEREGKPNIIKRTFTFLANDGQKHYPEIRNAKIGLLDYIQEGDRVEILFILQGTEKNDKRYNNILINSIRKI
tara:strand:+ start:90 stop:368 length:279 start_codon:yes stop_codon:yes gene_type:complete